MTHGSSTSFIGFLLANHPKCEENEEVTSGMTLSMKTGRHQVTVIVVLTCLLLVGADIARGKTTVVDDALFEAAAKGDLQTVRSLAGKGANVNARNAMGETPLHVAKSEEVARFLMERGADVNARDNDFEMTPLFNQSLEIASSSSRRVPMSLPKQERVRLLYGRLLGRYGQGEAPHSRRGRCESAAEHPQGPHHVAPTEQNGIRRIRLEEVQTKRPGRFGWTRCTGPLLKAGPSCGASYPACRYERAYHRIWTIFPKGRPLSKSRKGWNSEMASIHEESEVEEKSTLTENRDGRWSGLLALKIIIISPATTDNTARPHTKIPIDPIGCKIIVL